MLLVRTSPQRDSSARPRRDLDRASIRVQHNCAVLVCAQHDAASGAVAIDDDGRGVSKVVAAAGAEDDRGGVERGDEVRRAGGRAAMVRRLDDGNWRGGKVWRDALL